MKVIWEYNLEYDSPYFKFNNDKDNKYIYLNFNYFFVIPEHKLTVLS